jgi:hypothetical protein
VLIHNVNITKIVIIKAFTIIFVIVREIFIIVKNNIIKQYKYFIKSIKLSKLPKIIKSIINQPKNPKRTRNVLLKWYLKVFGEPIDWNFQVICGIEPIILVNPSENINVIIKKRLELFLNS